ncbi:hypothetical protein [Lentibacillus salicampi]|uniref:Uncharacterized protein n=1 Tax=Lentibacillus salicampi TaxID=175306 RepID=A0A4Y9ABL9_9BACI|nr:hypothetical protein [Lentibacillus salicampi]TFJ93213.1 hypothetical protein E4U82_08410 [Lentibacillus salicampi]
MNEPKRKPLNLPLAKVGPSNNQQKLHKENETLIRRLRTNRSKRQYKTNPNKSFLIAEEILEDIISEGYTENNILKEFRNRISELD